MADLQKLVDELSTLTVLEAAELSKLLEEKWGVSAAAPVAAAAAPAAAAAAPVEEQTEFTVILASAGDQDRPAHHGARGQARACGSGLCLKERSGLTPFANQTWFEPIRLRKQINGRFTEDC